MIIKDLYKTNFPCHSRWWASRNVPLLLIAMSTESFNFMSFSSTLWINKQIFKWVFYAKKQCYLISCFLFHLEGLLIALIQNLNSCQNCLFLKRQMYISFCSEIVVKFGLSNNTVPLFFFSFYLLVFSIHIQTQTISRRGPQVIQQRKCQRLSW